MRDKHKEGACTNMNVECTVRDGTDNLNGLGVNVCADLMPVYSI